MVDRPNQVAFAGGYLSRGQTPASCLPKATISVSTRSSLALLGALVAPFSSRGLLLQGPPLYQIPRAPATQAMH